MTDRGSCSAYVLNLDAAIWCRSSEPTGPANQRSDACPVASSPHSEAVSPGTVATSPRGSINALRQHAADGIGLIVSHRLTSLDPQDRVVMIEEGQIVGDGQHGDLWETNDAYQRFFRGQMSAVASLSAR